MNPSKGKNSFSNEPQQPPLPGEYWFEEQGFYAGITPSGWHLILPDSPSCYFQDIPWGTSALQPIDGADSEHDGLANTHAMARANSELALRICALPGTCYLPSRFESALLYATLYKQIARGDWYWTSTQYSSRNAWFQYFSTGFQLNNSKDLRARARAVRRLACARTSHLLPLR